MTFDEAVEQKFEKDAEAIRIKYTPILPHGFTIGYVEQKFEARMGEMKKEIIEMGGDLSDNVKQKVADQARQKIIDFIDDHNKKENSF